MMESCMASYAVTEHNTKGRDVQEPAHPYRGHFERDRDRIIHCAAFRRLEGKTQVFTPGLDDYYRTRLTHSIEVAQIGRTMARALRLNESLTEAICLAHDLGHAPFGHAGEHVLNDLMQDHGGFEHNRQSLRIVTLLEHPYPDFMGLNLMYETRLGLARHESAYDHPALVWGTEKQASLEGQIADLADRIAYNCHDLEDGQRARLIDASDLMALELFAWSYDRIGAHRIPDHTIRRTRSAKAILDRLVSDAIETSRQRIQALALRDLEEIYQHQDHIIGLSPETDQVLKPLEAFLLNRFYRHDRLEKSADQIQQWLGQLFERLCLNTDHMPGYFRGFISQHGLERTIADYIAGMTDRYCLKRLENLFNAPSRRIDDRNDRSNQ